mgnify:CR=1 FL=1
MDITIQNVRAPALEHNGRYYKVFQPRTRDELLKLHHMGCTGDTVITDIQLEQGDFPTSFVEPTITQRTLSGLFKDLRSIELEMRDQNSTLWSKIQKSNQGALTQFFDTNVKSAIAQTANEIRQEVRDASNSARVQVTSEGVTIGSTTLTGEQLASTISTSPRGVDIIAPKIKVKSDMIVDGAITASKIGAGAITTNALDAGSVTADKLVMDSAMARRFVASDLFTDTLAAKTAFINKLRSVVVSATLLEGYKGRIGGFQIGTHDKDPSTYWLTGQNQFAVGMSNGSSAWGQVALWVNWGTDWGKAGPYAWYVLRTGEMYCKNNADFFKKVDFATTSTANFYGNVNCYKKPIFYGGLSMWDSEIIGAGPNPKGGENAVVWWNQIGSGSVKYWIDKSSDRRLKENILSTSVQALNEINQLNLVSFDYIENKKHEEIGLIAQEVEDIIPQAISRDPESEDSYLHIDYTAFVPYLIKAIQELNQKLEEVNERRN